MPRRVVVALGSCDNRTESGGLITQCAGLLANQRAVSSPSTIAEMALNRGRMANPGRDRVPAIDADPTTQSKLIHSLVSQLESGSAVAEAKLVSLGTNPDHFSDFDPRTEILNSLALSAAEGSPYSMELLLRFVVEQQLANPAITRVVQAPSTVEDILQEVLVAISASLHHYRGDAKFTTWLYTLARNVSISHVRRLKPTDALSNEDDEQASGARRMSSLVAERDMLRVAIDELPDKYRDTVVMRDIQGMSYAEIAKRQGLEISTVRTRLSRGRAMLAIKLP